MIAAGSPLFDRIATVVMLEPPSTRKETDMGAMCEARSLRLVTAMDAIPELYLQRRIKIGSLVEDRIATFALMNVTCAEDQDQTGMMTALRLRITETITVRTIVTSEPRLNHTLLLATGVMSFPTTLPLARAAAVMAPALRTYRVRCSNLLSPLGQWHHGRIQVMEG